MIEPTLDKTEGLGIKEFCYETAHQLDIFDEDLIEKWYMQRFKKVLKLNKDKPNNFYYEMANGPLDDALKLAEETWQMVNLVNLREYIAPTKERASLILHKTNGHLIDRIYLRHI